MAKKVFTDESLALFVDEIKSYIAYNYETLASDVADQDAVVLAEAQKSIETEKTRAEAVEAELSAAIDAKAEGDHDHNNIYYTIEQIDAMEFITVDDIDEICGTVFVETESNAAGGVSYNINIGG